MRKISYTVFLELEGALPGDRLCRLLQTVEHCGSINRAATELKMSYRHAWGLIKRAEEHLAAPLLTRRVGGAAGGGAELTEAGRDLLAQYRSLRAQVDSRAPQILPPGQGPPAAAGVAHPVLLASTISPVETGLVAALEEAFLDDTGIPVRHIAAGSGQALQIAREGRADLVLSHAPSLEEAFLAEGCGAGRYPLMYNDFLLVGPAADPAGVAAAGSVIEAFRRCAAAPAPFLSRGDQSGTHVRETALWAAAGLVPGAPWFRACSKGAMGSLATLRCAEQEQAYMLVDRAAYLVARAEGLRLAVLVAGDPVLRNDFALIPVSPHRFPQNQHRGATAFVAWATGPRGQAVIGRFGVDRLGEPLFLPAGP